MYIANAGKNARQSWSSYSAGWFSIVLLRTDSLYLAHLNTIKRIDPGNFGDYPHKA